MAIIHQRHEGQHYTVFFNQQTGLQMRAEDKGYEEPFWSQDGPELLDFSITNYCERECQFCYRHSNQQGKNIYLKEAELVIDQAQSAGVLQIALGGGNPNQHPQFVEILKMIREHNIVPSYTSNGMGLTEEILTATKECCGAMALSVYPPISDSFIEKIQVIVSMGIKLNLHIILSTVTYEILKSWLTIPPTFLDSINAVIILTYKPIVSSQDYLKLPKEKVKEIFELASRCKGLDIGFDSCSVSGIVTYMHTKKELIEPCEASRFSAFISEDLKMYPCSFMANTNRYGDLRDFSLLDIWRNNLHFKKFRSALEKEGCVDCALRSTCMGGCHFIPTINQCAGFVDALC
jgi:radical SAM protein with 4Fe4S-binding SPASM domain